MPTKGLKGGTVNGEVPLPSEVKKGKKAQRVHDGSNTTAQDHQAAANDFSIRSDDEPSATGEDEGAAFSARQKHTLKRKRKRRKAAGSPSSKELAHERISPSNCGGGNEDASGSKETEQVSVGIRESLSSGSSASSSSSGEESSLEEDDSEDGDGERRADDSTAFGRAFKKIMKKKLPSSVLGEAMGPILSAHKQLVAKKLEEAEEGRKARSESKKEKQAIREQGHNAPAPYTTAKDKELIKLATRGVVKLFNAVSKAQSVQDAAKVAGTTEAKDLAKRSKSAFLAMLQGGNGSNPKVLKQSSTHKKEGLADEPQPGWSALQDTFMLGKSRLKDWDKKRDEGTDVEGIRDSGDDSDSE